MNEPKPTIRLGATGPAVFPIALGCMGMSGMYGATSEAESIATIQQAIERGVTLLDAGDFYGMGHNELLIHKAIEGRRDKVQLSVKFGAMRGPDGAWLGIDTSPAAVKNFASYSLRRLGVEVIDVYRPSRLDPRVPIEDTVGAIGEKQPGFVPVVGARTRAQLEEALGALDRSLSAQDQAALEALLPVDSIAGTRYGAEQMRHLDSERQSS